MNGKRTRYTGANPRSKPKRNARSKAVKSTARKIGQRAKVRDSARQRMKKR